MLAKRAQTHKPLAFGGVPRGACVGSCRAMPRVARVGSVRVEAIQRDMWACNMTAKRTRHARAYRRAARFRTRPHIS